MRIVVNVTKSIFPKILFLGIFIFVLVAVIAYARGYRFDLKEKKVTSTGIIAVNSSPKAAKVFINGELKGATDVNLTLPYGQYKVEVKKDGYTSWEKSISLKGELVMSVDAKLFSKNPSLTPLTTMGILKAISVGATNKLILISQTGDAEKDGLYLFDLGSKPLAIFPPLKMILLKSLLDPSVDLTRALIDFSPNYREGIITMSTQIGQVSYLISTESENVQLFEVTNSKENILQEWNKEKNLEALKIIETLPKKIIPVAEESFQILSLSPDEKKLMYLAKQDATLPLIINPPLIGANQTQEERSIKKGKIYIYDKKEDKNFLVPFELNLATELFETEEVVELEEEIVDVSASEEALTQVAQVWNEKLVDAVVGKIQWYPTSDYVAVIQNQQIKLIQYDGTNEEIVYAGPFQSSFFTISPDWNLLVLINLNPHLNNAGDLYSISIK